MNKKEKIKAMEAAGLSPDDIRFEVDKMEFFEKYPDAPVSEDIECLNLIMRKEFAMQILRGEKKVEVRAYSQFYYNRLFDKKVLDWADAKADEMADKGVPEDEVNDFVQDCIDFLNPLKNVRKIHFHNYDNTWFLDVTVSANYQVAVVREQVETLQELYDCHEFDEMLADLEKQKAKQRPLYFYFVVGDVIGTNLQ